MKIWIVIFTFIVAPNLMAKEVGSVTVKVCRDLWLGKYNDSEVQAKVNADLAVAINKVNPSRVITIQYGNDESGFFRDKSNSCIVATAWFEK